MASVMRWSKARSTSAYPPQSKMPVIPHIRSIHPSQGFQAAQCRPLFYVTISRQGGCPTRKLVAPQHSRGRGNITHKHCRIVTIIGEFIVVDDNFVRRVGHALGPDGDRGTVIFRSWSLLERAVANDERPAVRYLNQIAGGPVFAVGDLAADHLRP